MYYHPNLTAFSLLGISSKDIVNSKTLENIIKYTMNSKAQVFIIFFINCQLMEHKGL